MARRFLGTRVTTALMLLTKFTCSTLLVLLRIRLSSPERLRALCPRRLSRWFGALIMTRGFRCRVCNRMLQCRLLHRVIIPMLCTRPEKLATVLVIRIVSLWAGVSIRTRGVPSLGLRPRSRGKENVVAPLSFARVTFRMLWLPSRRGTYLVRTGDGPLQFRLPRVLRTGVPRFRLVKAALNLVTQHARSKTNGG